MTGFKTVSSLETIMSTQSHMKLITTFIVDEKII